MGSGASTKIADASDFVAAIDDEVERKHLAEAKKWKLFSEDIEWASMPVYPNKGNYLLGRREEADIEVANKTTSGEHLRIVFDKEAKRWLATDVGSSTGSLVMKGKETVELTKGEESEPHALGICTGLRLGRAHAVLVSSQVLPHMVIECTEGPPSLKGQTWKVPENSRMLSCGANPKADIDLSEIPGLEKEEFQIFKYSGWFAISDVSSRSKKTKRATKNEEEGNTKAFDDVKMVAQDSSETGKNRGGSTEPKTKKSKCGLYINHRIVKRREMIFLWCGAHIALGIDDPEKDSPKLVAKFVVKVKLRRLKI